MSAIFRPVNWNKIEDPIDLEVWNRLTSNFWLPEKVPLSNDISSWATLTPEERLLTMRVFTGLTLLDTLQGTVGAIALIPDAVTQHEEAIYANIAFMECLTGDHDLLTPSGWKSISEITVDDLVAQYNPDSKTTEFVHPIQTSHHTAESTFLFESEGGLVKQHVSPGHRVVIERLSSGVNSNDWVQEVIEAKDINPADLNEFTRFINTAPSATDGSDSLTATERAHVAGADAAVKLSDHFDLSTFTAAKAQDFIASLPGEIQGEDLLFSSAEKDNEGFVSAVAALAGYQAAGGKDSCCVMITKNKRHTSGQVVIKREMPGEEVYGIEVPSTFLLTRNGHSVAVTGNCVHAKSYSSIFSTLATTTEIDEAYRWSEENPLLQKKAEIMLKYYKGDDPLKKKVASTLLESFMFYSGFYLPMYWSSRGKLTNTADLIRLIIKDEAVHGFAIGYKYQIGLAKETSKRQAEMKDWTFELLHELYENEVAYTHDLYDSVGLAEDVKKFLNYNANKALMNLGYEAMFPATVTDVNPSILAALSPDANENHDFFSGSGSSYVIGKAVSTEDGDWDF